MSGFFLGPTTLEKHRKIYQNGRPLDTSIQKKTSENHPSAEDPRTPDPPEKSPRNSTNAGGGIFARACRVVLDPEELDFTTILP